MADAGDLKSPGLKRAVRVQVPPPVPLSSWAFSEARPACPYLAMAVGFRPLRLRGSSFPGRAASARIWAFFPRGRPPYPGRSLRAARPDSTATSPNHAALLRKLHFG
jgi:hypothetical protein